MTDEEIVNEKRAKRDRMMKNVEAILDADTWSEIDKENVMKTTWMILTLKAGWSQNFNDPENYVMDSIREDPKGFASVSWLQVQGLVETEVDTNGMFTDVILSPTNH